MMSHLIFNIVIISKCKVSFTLDFPVPLLTQGFYNL